MRRLVAMAISVLCLGVLSPVLLGGERKEADRDVEELQGVWKGPPPRAKGPGAYHIYVFDRDRLLEIIWDTIDGEDLAGVSLPCTYRLDTKAHPKAMTIRRWDLKDLPAREAI